MSRWIWVPAALACALAAALFVPFLVRDRELVAATPSPRPLFSVTFVDMPPGEQLCIDDVTIPENAGRVRLQVRTFGRPGPELRIALDAPGYRQQLVVPAGYADLTTLSPPLAPPAAARLGRVCLDHDGANPVALVGTTEARTASRPHGALAGTPIDPDTYLAFTTGTSASALGQTPAIVDRMTAFRPGAVGPWLLWPLLALVVAGVPAAVLWAVKSAVRS